KLMQYEHLWTTQRDRYILIWQIEEEHAQYSVYRRDTNCLQSYPAELGAEIINRMRDAGVEVLDPEEWWWRQLGIRSEQSDPITLHPPAESVSHPEQRPFFPAGVLEDGSFGTRWYSRILAAMGEPSLWQASQDATLHAYRFLWLRT